MSIYGADRWERAYGPSPAPSWVDGLAHCTLADLARVVEEAERDDSGRLPTLGVARLWAKEFQPGTFAGAAAQHRTLPSLPELASSSEVGRRWLAVAKGEETDPAMQARVEAELAKLREKYA